MSRTLFTEDQIAALRQNPYVYSVTPATLALTKEFEEVFYTEYQNGTSPRKILEDHGFDISVLGERRAWSISQHIREEYNTPNTANSVKDIEAGSHAPVRQKNSRLQNRISLNLRSAK